MDQRDGATYEALFRRSPKPMYVFAVRTLAFVDVNDAALELYGYDRATFLALTALDIRPADEIAPFYLSLRTDDPGDRVWRHRRGDGSEFLAEVDWMRHQVAGLDCEIAVVTDVTAREEAVASLERSEARLRDAVDLLLDGFNLFSAIRDEAGAIVDFRFEYVNDAAGRILGRSRTELMGATVLELFPAASSDGLVERYGRVVETGEPLELESEGRPDVLGEAYAERFFAIRAARVGDGLGVAFRDITNERIREADRSRRVVDAGRRLAELSAREREILDLALAGKRTTRDIARSLHISTRTVESHLASTYRKLHVASRPAALATYGQLLGAAETGSATASSRERTEQLVPSAAQ